LVMDRLEKLINEVLEEEKKQTRQMFTYC
jgi:hypothetical protein